MEWIKVNDNGEVEILNEEVKLVPEFAELMSLNYNKGPKDADGRKKFRLKNELKYLYLAYSFKSPYKDFSETERIAEARADCGLDKDWKESEQLKALIPKFQKGTESKIARSINTINKFLDKFETFLNDLNLNERNMSGGLVHNPKAIMQTLEELPDLAIKLAELERQVRQDTVQRVGSKGDHELGWLSKNNNKAVKKKVDEIETDE